MNDKLVIDENIEVVIRKLKQRQTYYGSLEGLPTIETNLNILAEAEKDAKAFCNMDNIHSLIPDQIPIKFEGTYPFGIPSILPYYICIAELRYHGTFKDNTKDYSGLGLIWFQNDYAFPIHEIILEKVKRIPFRFLCFEGEY